MVSGGGGGTGWARTILRMRGRFFWRFDEFYGIQTDSLVLLLLDALVYFFALDIYQDLAQKETC